MSVERHCLAAAIEYAQKVEQDNEALLNVLNTQQREVDDLRSALEQIRRNAQAGQAYEKRTQSFTPQSESRKEPAS